MAKGPIGKPKSYSTWSTRAGAAPSRMIRSASAWRGASIRLPTKPGQTPTGTAILPRRRAAAMTVARTSGEVAAPRTTSSSSMTLAGEKKCIPTTLSGCLVAAAMAFTSRPEVLVANTASGLAMSSRAAKTRFLRSMSSNTASITMSAPARAVRSSEPAIRPIRASASAPVIPPRAAVRS